MNRKRDTTSASKSVPTRFRRRIGRAPLTLLALVALALAVPVREANGQGTIKFNMRVSGAAVNQTGHIWGPSTNNPFLAFIGLGSNDNPSGATFGSTSGMVLIGQGTNGFTSTNQDGFHLGYRTTFAQLIGAVGQNMPESASVDAPWATVEIVAWDNSSGLYPTWAEASAAWRNGLIVAGHSAPFNVANIGGTANGSPYLTSAGVQVNGLSFNLHLPCLSCFTLDRPFAWTYPATDVTTSSAVLRGQVDPNGHSTTAWFGWGTTTGYSNTTAAAYAGDCICYYFLTSLLTGLTPGTTYHFRTAATNIYGGGAIYPGPYDGDQSFTTLMPSPLTINTGSGYWGAASSDLSYAGSAGTGQRFILLQSADPTTPLSAWTRVAT